MNKFVIWKFNFRHLVLIAGIFIIIAGLGARLLELQILERDFLRGQGDARTMRVVKIPSHRGVITDRNGEPLAISTPVQSVWINPKKFNPAKEELLELVAILHLDLKEIQQKLTKAADKSFIYLRRHVMPEISQQVEQLHIAGLHLQEEYKRYYPTGEVLSHVIGFTGIDDDGQEGLELQYENWLAGSHGARRIVIDRLGREVEFLAEVAEQRPGNDLTLSFDQRLQYLAFRELKASIEQHMAASGSAVILDVTSGEVLAMANYPSFNPNVRHSGVKRENRRNLAVTDYFEVGSVMKPLSILSVLEHSDVKATTLVDTAPGYMQLRGGVVREHNHENNGVIDVATILKRSSNVGVSKLVLALPYEALWDTYSRLGFGSVSDSGFPGESPGVLAQKRFVNPFEVATMSFGYGVGVTQLQLARAYAILGAGGVKLPISFIKNNHAPLVGERVVSEEVAREVVDMLAGVVENNLSNAKVPGYRVAGKTGTARKLGKDGYEQGRHRSVFAGLAPAVNAKFAIVVTINEPSAGKYYGNQVAAPVFAKIAAGALRLFNVAPDVVDTQGVYVVQNGNNHS